MTQDMAAIRAMVRELAALPFGPPHKPDPCQNLTDMLELAAVAHGIKPAHLQGQGFRSEAVLQDLERIVPRIELQEKDVTVDVTLPGDADVAATLRIFPYIQFSAYPECLARPEGPAGLINQHMRELAFDIAPRFGKAIWKARDRVVLKGSVRTYGRNDTCPCGSGTKFKKCCAVIPD